MVNVNDVYSRCSELCCHFLSLSNTFSQLMLLNTKDRKKKGELRRSHFEGVKVRLGFSRKLMTIELQVNQVQVCVCQRERESERERERGSYTHPHTPTHGHTHPSLTFVIINA